MSTKIAARLTAFLGDSAGVGFAHVTGPDGLWPDEAVAVAKAIPKRQAEFAAGRRAARDALRNLGEGPVALPVGPRRAPVWPEGIVGSISHDAGHAIAAVARQDRARGLGIDLTEAAALPGETRASILPHAEEQGFDPLQARAGFSAKESLFKALFPLTETFFGFEAALVIPDLEAGRFTVQLTRSLGSFDKGTEWAGHVAVQDDLILTALVVT